LRKRGYEVLDLTDRVSFETNEVNQEKIVFLIQNKASNQS